MNDMNYESTVSLSLLYNTLLLLLFFPTIIIIITMFPPPPATLDWNEIGFKVRDGTHPVPRSG